MNIHQTLTTNNWIRQKSIHLMPRKNNLGLTKDMLVPRKDMLVPRKDKLVPRKNKLAPMKDNLMLRRDKLVLICKLLQHWLLGPVVVWLHLRS